jgi:putative methyltransferase (TIGR04325 family)
MLKAFARSITPPLLWQGLSATKRRIVPPPPPPPQYGHTGRYARFEDARAASTDYQREEILAETAARTRAAAHGCELFHLDAHLLAALQTAQLALRRPAHIVDFGGALGRHYFALRRFVGELIASWHVVELPATSAYGAEHFADGTLTFGTELREADVMIASGALQCVPQPYATLGALKASASYVILDKLPLHDEDRITVHRLPPSAFGCEVSLPIWFFDRQRFMAAAGTPIMAWQLPDYCPVLDGAPCESCRGLLLRGER